GERVPRQPLALEANGLTCLDAGRKGQIERAAIGKRDAFFGAVDRFEEADLEPILRILPPHGEALTAATCPSPSAEQIAEQVGEAAEILVARSRAVTGAILAAGIFAVIALLLTLLAARVDLAEIVAAPLLGIAEDVVSRCDLFELVFRRLVPGVKIRVELLGELAVCLGDVLSLCGARDAEN